MDLGLNDTLEIVDVGPQFVVDSKKSIGIQFTRNGKRGSYLMAQEIHTTELPSKARICASTAPACKGIVNGKKIRIIWYKALGKSGCIVHKSTNQLGKSCEHDRLLARVQEAQ
jgi:hypothetical protein